MATRERPTDRATRAGTEQLATIARELRLARTAAGLSQREVAAAARVSHPTVSRVERASNVTVSILVLGRIAAAVGLELSVRLYAGGDPVRDAGHARLLAAFRERLHPLLGWRTEVPLPLPGDRRAWDAVIRGPGWTVGVEAETRLRDLQAVVRKIALKSRDGEVDHVALVVAGTRGNRAAIRAGMIELAAFDRPQRDALRDLRVGRDPGGSALIIL